MSCYQTIGKKKKKVCIGSMSSRIKIQKRVETFLSTGKTYTFVDVWEVWANKTGVGGYQKFSGININDIPTDVFNIRDIEEITSEYWVNYEGDRYRIIEIRDVEDDRFKALYCRQTGVDTKEGAKS